MIFFISDEHYFHTNIIKYCNRPFDNVEEMNETLISNFNSVVREKDVTVHAGDFALCSRDQAQSIIKRLNGEHTFLIGSHDRWLGKKHQWDIRAYRISGRQVIVGHYCLRTWPRSHYNSWHLYGHSHGNLEPIGKSHDIGVDNNGFFPLSEDEIVEIMKARPDNPNLRKR